MAVLNVGGRQVHCAIEYERSSKSHVRYEEIRRSISDERLVDAILYIVSGRSDCFWLRTIWPELTPEFCS